MRKCSVLGCERKHKGFGFCKLHYRRIKTGYELLAPVEKQIHSGFKDQLAFYTMAVPCSLPDISDNCIIWTGKKNMHGYGIISIKGKQQRVHRVVWEKMFGKMHPENVIDHLCHNRACVNINHLRFCQNTKHHMVRHKIPRGQDGRFLKAS